MVSVSEDYISPQLEINSGCYAKNILCLTRITEDHLFATVSALALVVYSANSRLKSEQIRFGTSCYIKILPEVCIRFGITYASHRLPLELGVFALDEWTPRYGVNWLWSPHATHEAPYNRVNRLWSSILRRIHFFPKNRVGSLVSLYYAWIQQVIRITISGQITPQILDSIHFGQLRNPYNWVHRRIDILKKRGKSRWWVYATHGLLHNWRNPL